MRIDSEAFRAAWPQVVRGLAVTTGSLDLGEEYAAEAFSRLAAQPDGTVDDPAAWCVRVGRRAWLDDLRRQRTWQRNRASLAVPESTEMTPDHSPGDDLDDRLALLFVACDEALPPGAQLVLAMRVVCGLSTRQIANHLGIAEATAAARLTRAKAALARARGEFVIPSPDERAIRLPTVLACISALLTVGQREVIDPLDSTADPARDALTLAEALVVEYPSHSEGIGLRATCRLALARRPGRVRDGGRAATGPGGPCRLGSRTSQGGTRRCHAGPRAGGSAGSVRARGGDLGGAYNGPLRRADRLGSAGAALRRAPGSMALACGSGRPIGRHGSS